MNQREMFKLALLENMADQGYTLDEVKAEVKKAVAAVKQGFLEGVGAMGLLGLAALPVAAGAGAGYIAANASQPNDETAKNIKTRELIEHYRQLAGQARINKLLQQRKLQERPSFSRI